eukprot:CAMPEP_0117436234 /NCGR_PEP_ID=MMETSP0759-20121206/901_1 /TAXON_ID=63605 /ORGANISM="Percolomonas cosmopolitus, Strain WS" /LENGTH=698 /DNA_ID=CAMNT_0005227825 /DNA_START=34 /DNA_END=2130 /DNA_ORIENTATION=-
MTLPMPTPPQNPNFTDTHTTTTTNPQNETKVILSDNGDEKIEEPQLLHDDDGIDLQSSRYFNDAENAETVSNQQGAPQVAHGDANNGDTLLELVQNSASESSTPESEHVHTPSQNASSPPPIPEHLRRLKQREKQSEATKSRFRGIASVVPFGIAYPPLIVGSGIATAHTIMQELRFRQKLDKESGLNDRPLTAHLSEMFADAKDALWGKADNEDTPQFSSQDLEASLLPQSECNDVLSKYDLPEPQSDFTNACLNGDRKYLQEHWDKLREQKLRDFDFSHHDHKYALHYAALAGRAEICKQLINHGADEKVEFNGKTPDQLTSNVIVVDTIRAFSILRRELDILIGMEKIKRNIYQMTNKIILDKRRAMVAQKNGSRVIATIPRRHMVICGNPGTGKTKVAGLIAHLYYALGIIKKNVFITAQRADLCAMYVGQTAPRTRKMIAKAAGGVLFVDEAYRLSQSDDPGKDYGQEAIDEIMQHMTDESLNRTIFIFAGYKKPMQRFIQSNPGIFRRVDFKLDFDDYSCHELSEIAVLNVHLSGYRLAPNVNAEIVEKMLEKHTNEQFRSQMNGGLSEKLVQFAIQVQSEMLSLDASEEELSILTRGNLEMAIKLLMCGGDIHSLENEIVEEAADAYNKMDDKEKKQIQKLAEKLNDMSQGEKANGHDSPTTPEFEEAPSVFDSVAEEDKEFSDLIDDLLD